MAKKVTVSLIDDTDGECVADETVEFGLDGQGYEIDLASVNAARLREQLRPWVAHARKVGRGVPARSRSTKERNAAVRQWAREQGREIGVRGRVPRELVEAYDAAHR